MEEIKDRCMLALQCMRENNVSFVAPTTYSIRLKFERDVLDNLIEIETNDNLLDFPMKWLELPANRFINSFRERLKETTFNSNITLLANKIKYQENQAIQARKVLEESTNSIELLQKELLTIKNQENGTGIV